jgi:HAD superfamily hydrolase (TIGR01459 family)
MTHDTKPAAGRAGARAPLLVASFGELAPRIDVLICDVWGVVHNGARAHVQACAALERFRAGGGKVVLVSNAPRPADSVVRQMVGYGVPETVFDGIVTSGDLTRQLISERPGQRVLHLGPERDISLFAAFGTTFADADSADYCVCTGLLDDETETAADYAPRLARIAGRGLEMICANPDLVVERGDRLLPCAGALAQVYEGLGGRVIYAGKPHLPVYARALQMRRSSRAARWTCAASWPSATRSGPTSPARGRRRCPASCCWTAFTGPMRAEPIGAAATRPGWRRSSISRIS